MTDPLTVEQIAEQIDCKVQLAISAVRCDGSIPTGSFAPMIRDALHAARAEALDTLQAFQANDAAIRSTYGWKRDGRELPALIAELVQTVQAEAMRDAAQAMDDSESDRWTREEVGDWLLSRARAVEESPTDKK
jgi:hypothetical protein